jgi:hypothetical protein
MKDALTNIKNSKTLKVAWAKKLLGLVSLIITYSGHFENSMAGWSFGVFMIFLGLLDNYLRHITIKPLAEK